MKTSTNSLGETTWTLERTNDRGELTKMTYCRRNGDDRVEVLRHHYPTRGPVEVRGGGVDGYGGMVPAEAARKHFAECRAAGYR